MSKNAEGWVRHRGGKCPVDAGAEVSTRHRDGKIVDVHHMTAYADASEASLKCVWSHKNDDDDIMAYKLHKPAEQVEECSKPELQINLPDGYGEIYNAQAVQHGPLKWRDRIAEIDVEVQARTVERADLVQKLAGEGFALIGRVVDTSAKKEEWKRHAEEGRKINAIKHYRELHGSSLRDAKDAVELYQSTLD